MRTHTLAAGDEISIGGVRVTVLAVDGEDVVFGLCPPEATEVVCEPPESALAPVAAGDDRGLCPPEGY